jgi:hypothetical protein
LIYGFSRVGLSRLGLGIWRDSANHLSDGDDNAVSTENAEIQTRLRFEHDSTNMRDYGIRNSMRAKQAESSEERKEKGRQLGIYF